MILVHLIAGMVSGLICAAMLWLFDYPLWLMLLSYPIAGGLGLFASALVGHATEWLADNGRNRKCRPSARGLMSDRPGKSVNT